MDTNSQKEDGRFVVELILATGNPNKTREFRELLGPEFEVNDLNSFPELRTVDEPGRTFTENATLKAMSVSKHRPELVIADDSGLEVEALNGAPGIYSARYAGENANDQDNIRKLLRALCDARSKEKSARFACVIAAAQNGKLFGTFEGVVEGRIVALPRGTNGFGYDSVFQPNGFEQTFAEMPPELKNKISHRAQAVAALRHALRGIEN